MRTQQLDVDACKAGLEEIDARLKLGKLSEAEANAARLTLLARPHASRWAFHQDQKSGPQTFIVVATVFLLVSGVGAVTSYLEYPRREFASADGSASDAELLARLQNYAGSIPAEDPAPAKTAGTMLPDVNTMIDRLAARLETNPKDLEGWRTLGWSYFHMARYDQAATAFGRAVDLDPASAELKRSYDDAKAKAAVSSLETASTSQAQTQDQTQAGASGNNGASAGEPAPSATVPAAGHDGAIRSMVDGLARRLEHSPRDADGWTSLMRSRVVLGETGVADTAFRKALEVFKDDPATTEKIRAAAADLGLKTD
jgi:cytochrome c-type biogenesis protein CcmH